MTCWAAKKEEKVKAHQHFTVGLLCCSTFQIVLKYLFKRPGAFDHHALKTIIVLHCQAQFTPLVFINMSECDVSAPRFLSSRPRHGHPRPPPLSPPAPQHEAPRAGDAPHRLWSASAWASACYGAPSSASQPGRSKEWIHQ